MLEAMSKVTMSQRNSPRGMGLQGVALGAGLTLLFGALALFIANVAQAPAVMLLLSAAAFVAAGFVALRLGGAGFPLEPAIGAALTVLSISLIELWVTPELTSSLEARQIAISLLVSVLFAFNLAWLGGVLGQRRRLRVLAKNAELASRRVSEPRAIDRFGPGSQPAPRSG